MCQNVKQPKLPGEENFEALPMRAEDDEQKGTCSAMMQSLTQAEHEEYRELTAHEERDVESLLASCDWSQLDIDVFGKHLTDELGAIEAVMRCFSVAAYECRFRRTFMRFWTARCP